MFIDASFFPNIILKAKKMPKALVSVPKLGKRCFRTVGVFIADKGIINVDIPPGLWFGDEFEVTYSMNENQEKQKYIRVPLPMNVQPGHCFRHRAPNGKSVLVSCPPGVKPDCDLLVPWSDSSNELFPIQAQIAPPESPKPKQKPVQTPPQRNPSPHTNRPPNISQQRRGDGFNVDDLELARALSLTTLNIQPVADDAAALEQAIQASMREAEKEREKYVKMQSSAYAPNHKTELQTSKVEADDDIALRLALEASLKEAESQAAMLRKQFTPATSGQTQSKPTAMSKSPSPVLDDCVDEEEIMLPKVKSLSSSQNSSPLKAAPFASVKSSYSATGPVSGFTTGEGMVMEPYAFTKTDPTKIQRNGS